MRRCYTITVDDEFLKMIEKLQEKIEYIEDKIYSKKVIQEFRNPTNFGFIKNPDASGKLKGLCGDTMRIDMNIKNKLVTDIRFWTDGCGASIACGNMLTKMIKGKSIEDIKKITKIDLLNSLDGLPIEHQHCTILAINTLHKCLEYHNKKKELL